MQYETLTDLLNNDPAAYSYFYGLPPQVQTRLRQGGELHDMTQLRAAATAASAAQTPHRPAAF